VLNRFDHLTETTGTPASREGIDMLYSRYQYTRSLGVGKRVLELACGSGQGLSLLARSAEWTVGGDIDPVLLKRAREHYGSSFPLVRLSAQDLPFTRGAFDVVLLLEASYYLPDGDGAFAEVLRVLAPGGLFVVVNANPERPDFIRSPLAVHYHTADEFRRTLAEQGFSVIVEGAFPLERNRTANLKATARNVLGRLGLAPRSLKARAILKRLAYGKLTAVPAEIPEDFGRIAERFVLPAGPIRDYKVLYVTAVK
jgi:SAM-dependent methyltransferase